MNKVRKRRNDSLSRERIIAAAIEILDKDGESALTFRALAAHLSTGAGAMYHHVENKSTLLAAASDRIIGIYLSDIPQGSDPSTAIRTIAAALWDTGENHPWVGRQLLLEPNPSTVAKIYESIGQQLAPLGVPQDDQFNVCSALAMYMAGIVSQQISNNEFGRTLQAQGLTREAYLEQMASPWKSLDPAEYPFMSNFVTQFPTHDDKAQYIAGIELLLAGITAKYQTSPQTTTPKS